MDKKFMNKLDEMELDMVAGGKKKKNCSGEGGSKLGDYIESGVTTVVDGAKSVVGVFERFFRMARTRSM